MRLIKTFVLHLYVDTEASERLCGDLQAMPDRKSLAFKNQAELITRLQQSIRQALEKTKSTESLSNPENSVKKDEANKLA